MTNIIFLCKKYYSPTSPLKNFVCCSYCWIKLLERPYSILVKINFDGLMINNNATTDFVIRYDHGTPFLAGAKNVGVNNKKV